MRIINLGIAFKFWHVSVNGNDLSEINNADSTVILSEILKPENELKKYFLVNYFPNPTSGNIQVSSSGEPLHSLTITDLTGNIVMIESNLNKFPCRPSLPPASSLVVKRCG